MRKPTVPGSKRAIVEQVLRNPSPQVERERPPEVEVGDTRFVVIRDDRFRDEHEIITTELTVEACHQIIKGEREWSAGKRSHFIIYEARAIEVLPP